MASDSNLYNGTRSMIEMTSNNIAQLDSTFQCCLDQEHAIISEIGSLEYKIREKKQQHAQLSANIAAIRRSITNMKDVEENFQSALSAIRHLTDEVLLHVFRIVVQEADRHCDRRAELWTVPSRNYKLLHWRLGSVCSRWNKIMTENLSLWTTVAVRLRHSTDASRDRERQRFQSQIKFGKSCEQTLFIEDWKPDRHGFLLTLINGQCQWKAIHISVVADSDDGTWDVENISSNDLKICRVDLPTCAYFLPLMRRASILILYGQTPEWSGLPWIHLRSLTIKDFATCMNGEKLALLFGYVEFTDLLVAATELNELVLDFPAKSTTLMNQASDTITHRNLTSLSLHLDHFVAGKGPFGVILNTPSLQTLDFISIACENSDRTPFPDHWDDPKILSLPNMNDTEVPLAVELTKSLPNVNTLIVMGGNIDTLFTYFHSLLHHIPPRSLPLPLPKLDSLFITDTDIRGETLIELLECRLRHVRGNTEGVSAITDIKMYNSPAVSVSHWKRFQELLLEGIRSTEIVIEGGGGQYMGLQ